MHAQRCSLMLRTRDEGWLYLAAARGIAPGVAEGARIRIGDGVAGRVAASREPLLVRDVSEAKQHPLLRDQYFTTGSFISFPLIYHDRSEEHTSELQSQSNLVCRLLLEKKKSAGTFGTLV